MASNTFDFKNQAAEKYKKIIHKINDILSLPECNLYVLFDNQEWPLREGFYMNLKVGSIETDVPDYILRTIKKEKFDHFIWIPNRTCVGDLIHFAWTYSHEVQHLKQSLQNPGLYFLHEFFWKNLLPPKEPDNPISPKIPITIPTENDAERAAKKAITQIFGKDLCFAFIKSEADMNEKWYEIISKVDINEKYDVEAETIRFLCKKEHKPYFIRRQTKLDNSSIVKKVDFDEICQKKRIPPIRSL